MIESRAELADFLAERGDLTPGERPGGPEEERGRREMGKRKGREEREREERGGGERGFRVLFFWLFFLLGGGGSIRGAEAPRCSCQVGASKKPSTHPCPA